MSIPQEFTLGDAKAFTVTLKDNVTGVPINLTGGSVRFQARGSEGPTFSYAGILSTSSGVNTVTRSSGNFTTDGVQVGQFLNGAIATMFPANTRISAVGTTTITMSQPANQTSSTQSGGVYGWTMDIAGSLVDAPNGVCSFPGIGSGIGLAFFGQRQQILFKGQVKYTNGANNYWSTSDAGIPVRISLPMFV